MPRRLVWVVGIAIGVWFASGLFRVGSHERAVVREFGRVTSVPAGGLHWTWPWPIGEVVRLEPDKVRSVQVGMSDLATLTGRRASDARTQYMTGDQGLAQVLVRVQYIVRTGRGDLANYLFRVSPAVAERMVVAAVEAAVTAQVSRARWDGLLEDPERKSGLFVRARQQAQTRLDRYACGVDLKAVSLVGLQAPGPVVVAFNDVLSAQSESNATVRQAESDAEQAVQQARARETEIRLEAQAYANRVVELAKAELADFPPRAAAYRAARDVTARRLWLEMLGDVLGKVRKVIVPQGHDGPPVDVSIVEPSP